jgi:hypothetical protein
MAVTRAGTRYRLVDVNGTVYEINDDTFKRLEDGSTIEVDIIERSFKAGADFPGIQRDESKEMTFQYALNRSDEQLYRSYENNFRRNLRRGRWLQDTINNIETAVLLREHVIAYDDGGFKLGSLNNVTLIQLKPYWQDIDFTVLEDSGASERTFTIINDGYVETPSIITLRALEACPKFQIVNSTNDPDLDGQGIVIQDLQFGTLGLDTYIIDNGDGSAELNAADRKNKIRQGTGFFNFAVGTNVLDFTLQGQCAINIAYKKRYYL